jgi:hypothetical protein
VKYGFLDFSSVYLFSIFLKLLTSELSQYVLKSHFKWSLSTCTLATSLVGSNIIGQNAFESTNNAQELTPCLLKIQMKLGRQRGQVV